MDKAKGRQFNRNGPGPVVVSARASATLARFSAYFFFLSGACVSAEAATDFTSGGVVGSASSLAAFDATLSLVFSSLAIT